MDNKRGGATSKKSGSIRFRTTMHNCVAYKVMTRRGWTEVHDDYDWDVFWADVHALTQDGGFDFGKLLEHQRVNHFPRHVELTRKDLMVKNLKRAKRQLDKEGRGHEMDFFPQTYTLPQEYGLFAEEFRRSGGTWIMKPCGRAQGKGIFLLDKLSQVTKWRKEMEEKEKVESWKDIYVVSRYLDNPLLIGGRKFDIRIYVLVISYSPLRVYLHRGGFCRFTSSRYNLTHDNIKDVYMHLTNVSIQKKADNYDRKTGMKWPMKNMKLYLASKFGMEKANRLFEDIQGIVTRSLLAVQHVVTQDKHSFEIYGYDVLVDADLKPWLIEVNASPSFMTDTATDFKLKYNLVYDALTLMDLENKLNGQLPPSLGGFDVIYDHGGAIQVHPSLPSMLGCDIPNLNRITKKGAKAEKRHLAEKAAKAHLEASMKCDSL
ncbi:hypothetical protein BSKO_13788 [Bryopsis sp. KO-2023]|nr:hypothetical protein BSKO_13788 [Bryopsis sp. KO-2023]